MKKLVALIAIIVLGASSSVFSGNITVETTHGTWVDGWETKILPCAQVAFDLRLDNSTGSSAGGINNGFRIYTSDGSPIGELTGEIISDYDFEANFDLIWNINVYANDPNDGDDTIKFGGSKGMYGEGLIAGHNDVDYRITVGGVNGIGMTLCIDSSWYPATGVWKWVNDEGPPDWGGPYCYESSTPPCIPNQINNCADELHFTSCETVFYDFDYSGTKCAAPNPIDVDLFSKIEGPGTIDPNTGMWSYTVKPEDYGTTQELIVGVYTIIYCGYNECSVMLSFDITDTHILGDVNCDCSNDIGDLVFFAEYQFLDGPEPPIFELADCNGSGEIDIEDLVYLVEYQFFEGPPPYNPWE